MYIFFFYYHVEELYYKLNYNDQKIWLFARFSSRGNSIHNIIPLLKKRKKIYKYGVFGKTCCLSQSLSLPLSLSFSLSLCLCLSLSIYIYKN